MSKIYKADIAEKILLSGESINDLATDCFQIGGKILFDDLSSVRCIGNINFLEKSIPKGILKAEYFEINMLKVSHETDKIMASINSKEGTIKITALRIEPSYQEQAESDYRSIVIFHNGECAVEDFNTNTYIKYDKNTANNFCSSFNLDNNLIQRKLQKDFEVKNNLKITSNKLKV